MCAEKLLRFVLDMILVITVISMLSLVITNIFSECPSVFGYRAMFVVSGSMEPTLMTDQMILGKVVDGEDLEVGDIAGYRSKAGKIIVHRIIAKEEDDGTLLFQFQGDNNDEPDPDLVPSSSIMYEIIKY